MINTGVGSWISALAARQPESPLITFRGRQISWGEFGKKVDHLAAGLVASGIVHGDRVACLMYNRPEFLELFWACMRIGAIFCPINVRLALPEMDYILGDLQVKMLVSEPAFAGRIADLSNTRDFGCCVMTEPCEGFENAVNVLASTNPVILPAVRPRAEDTAAILYTSGTTGLPKGAIISHGNVQAQATNFAATFGLTSRDRQLMFIPLCFTGGLMTICMNTFLVGSSMIMMEEFDAGTALDLIQNERPTWFSGVPVMFQRIFEHPRAMTTDFSSLRFMQGGGASVHLPLIEMIREHGHEMTQGYGLTEGSGGLNLILSQEHLRSRTGSAGKPGVLGMARVVDDDGRDCPPNFVGELLIGGPLVFQGYWNNPQATSETIRDGWLHTGDLARRDADGFFYIAGRKREMIITGGLNVYPIEVENVISAIDGVAEVAVVGVADPNWGEAVTAFVVMQPSASLTEEDLKHYTRQAIADYKVPKRIYFVDSLPRTTSNKVLKRALVEGLFAR